MSPVTVLNRQIRELNMINQSPKPVSSESLARFCKCGSQTHLRTSHRECPLNNTNKRKLFSDNNQAAKKTTIRETVIDF
jgi:hypothetical protein